MSVSRNDKENIVCPNPSCGKLLEYPPTETGFVAECPSCGGNFDVVTDGDDKKLPGKFDVLPTQRLVPLTEIQAGTIESVGTDLEGTSQPNHSPTTDRSSKASPSTPHCWTVAFTKTAIVGCVSTIFFFGRMGGFQRQESDHSFIVGLCLFLGVLVGLPFGLLWSWFPFFFGKKSC